MSHVTSWCCFGWSIFFLVCGSFVALYFYFSYFVIYSFDIDCVYLYLEVKFLCFLPWTINTSNLIYIFVYLTGMKKTPLIILRVSNTPAMDGTLNGIGRIAARELPLRISFICVENTIQSTLHFVTVVL